MAVDQDREASLAPWLELLEKKQDRHSGWKNERAAIALAGCGVRSVDGPLRRYGGMRSVDGSWRATRWSELPRVLSLPLPERLSAIWTMFPFDAYALALAEPNADEMSAVLAMVLRQIRGEERDMSPKGTSCLLACAAMAKNLGVALPPLETRWWLEQQVWGHAPLPTFDASGGAIANVAESEAHPALIRDSTLTTALSRGALRAEPLKMADSPYRDFGSGWALMANLDLFKSVCDSNGFTIADAVLAQLVDRWQRAFGDCVVRYGGDEFLILWKGDGGLDVAEEMRASVEREPFFGPGYDNPLDIRVSVGAARFDDLAGGIEKSLAALAEAKQAGRNCVRG